MSAAAAEIRNDGEWAPILAWLDEIVSDHAIMLGWQPPVTRDPASRALRVYSVGRVELVPVGGYVTWDEKSGFRARSD